MIEITDAERIAPLSTRKYAARRLEKEYGWVWDYRESERLPDGRWAITFDCDATGDAKTVILAEHKETR